MDKAAKAYFDAIPLPRRKRALALHALVLDCAPTATVDMHYRMPTYRCDGDWVAIANQKNYVSLYTCSAAHLAQFRKAHPGIKTGKGCINFRDSDVIPDAGVKQVVRHVFGGSPKTRR